MIAGRDPDAAEVLRFWFVECDPKQWFRRDPEFDALIAARFGEIYRNAADGCLDDWRETPDGALALVVTLDQFPRNMFRDDSRAYATDEKARAIAGYALACGFDFALSKQKRKFLYMPLQHSEDPADQERSVQLVRDRCDEARTLESARRHREIIQQFGRFPHRNAVLGRATTPEEAEFLKKPGSSF